MGRRTALFGRRSGLGPVVFALFALPLVAIVRFAVLLLACHIESIPLKGFASSPT
jgi:hypothetical protein